MLKLKVCTKNCWAEKKHTNLDRSLKLFFSPLLVSIFECFQIYTHFWKTWPLNWAIWCLKRVWNGITSNSYLKLTIFSKRQNLSKILLRNWRGKILKWKSEDFLTPFIKKSFPPGGGGGLVCKICTPEIGRKNSAIKG